MLRVTPYDSRALRNCCLSAASLNPNVYLRALLQRHAGGEKPRESRGRRSVLATDDAEAEDMEAGGDGGVGVDVKDDETLRWGRGVLEDGMKMFIRGL
jgi:hypothetical protein